MTATTVPELSRSQPTTAITGLQWIRAEDVKPQSPYILQSLPPRSSEITFSAPHKGSQSVVIDIEMLIERLARKVRLENPRKIREYLLRFAELLDLVPQAVDAAKRHFPEAQLVMDVYQDPEITDSYLVLYIRVKRYDDSVIERLEKAESEFLNQLVNKTGWIQLTTDFQEPEGEDAI